MTLRVVDAGLATFLVDGGRPHARSLGVPVGGAADTFSLAVGNGLVGNPPDAAALEITLAGPTLRAEVPLACVLYGAPFELAGDRQRLRAGKTFQLRPGEEVHIWSTPTGLRAYFCVRGGFQAPLLLGSRSSLEPLQNGTELACLPGSIHARFARIVPTWDADFPAPGELPGSRNPMQTLRVMEGPQAGWFQPDDFYPQVFEVTPASDRMGLRLQGRPLGLPGRELVSEPVCPGSVQVTSNGQCIVLGVDGQTIGGYPKIAQVISADLDKLGQLRTGDSLTFVQVSREEAEAIYRRKQATLKEWVTRLRVTLTEDDKVTR